MRDRPLLAALIATVDQAAFKAVVAEHLERVIDETLDEWDDAARWRTLVTRFGSDAIHEAAAMGAAKVLDDFFAELRG